MRLTSRRSRTAWTHRSRPRSCKGKPLVLATSDRCLASLRQITSQSGSKQVACLGNEGAPLGLAVAGKQVFAQVGQRLAYSDDGGRSFDDYPG